jgi:acetyl esterase/lipase
MTYQTVLLRTTAPAAPVGESACLTVYARDNSPEIDPMRRCPAVLICPGGGYGFVSDREAEPVALAFLAAGCTAAVLRYTVAPQGRYPLPLNEAAAALAFLRENADEWHIDPKRVFVCGFSAGGHLAAMLGCLWPETAQGALARPAGTILCYPVISGGDCAHRGSFENLTDGDPALTRRLSLETRVDENTAPAFLWHTADDPGVPAENSLRYASALARQGIPYALHIFPSGRHGLSLANPLTAPESDVAMVNPAAARWFGMAVDWIRGF